MKKVITAKSVIDKLPENHSPFPNSYLKLHRKLPESSFTIILAAANAAVEGGTKQSVIEEVEYLLDIKNGQYIIDLDNPITNFKSLKEKEEYEYDFKRELKVKQDLKLNGYNYPKDTSDAFDLLTELGLIFEEKRDGKTY